MNIRSLQQRVMMLLLLLSSMWALVFPEESINSRTEEAAAVEPCPFMIIIDGGSTGSRLHVFEFVYQIPKRVDTESQYAESEPERRLVLERRGSARADVPLSAFGPTREQPLVKATHVAAHLLPAFVQAARIIPPRYHATTTVKYQATAGMRLLSDRDQQLVYDAMYDGLVASPDFVFTALQREDIQTLSGELEGFYGAVAANYLQGIVTTNLELVAHPDIDELQNKVVSHRPTGPIGALDMGGSSTQIVFLPTPTLDTADVSSCTNPAVDALEIDNKEDDVFDRGNVCHGSTTTRLHGPDFFSTSYLSYGVDQFRERLWNTWVQQHDTERANKNDETCDSKVIENPCAFAGYALEWDKYTLIGTGDAHRCVEEVQRLIPHPSEADLAKLGSHVGGVEHPPIRGKFLAMSLFFFALDSLRELSRNHPQAHQALNESWPTPSIQELFDALEGLCSRSWHDDLVKIQHDAHAFTRAEVLPHRCLEAVYMVTLLRDGFGFAPESRDITFTFLVDGSEVEWTLGMALVLRQEQQQQHPVKGGPRASACGDDSEGCSTSSAHAPSTDVQNRTNPNRPTVGKTFERSLRLEEWAKRLFSSIS